MKYKDLTRKDWYMFENDNKHYQKDGNGTYYCFEERSHIMTSGKDFDQLQTRNVIKIAAPQWNT